MKKITKVVISLVLSIVLMLPAWVGAATSKGSIIIKNDPAVTGISMVDHKYGAYKIFDVVTGGEGVDKKYSYTVDSDFIEFFKSKAGSTDVSTEVKLNKFASDYVQKASDINNLAKELKEYIGSKNITVEGQSGAVNVAADKKEEVTIADLAVGYYIVLDNGNGGSASLASAFIAAAALGTTDTNLVINLKASVPTIDKQIKHNEDGTWGNVGDNQIGDVVEYKINSTIPSNLTGYKEYTYTIHDSLTEGLTFNNDIELYVGEKEQGNKLDAAYYTVTAPATDGNTFDISINILKALADKKIQLGDKLNTYYTAILNEKAVIADKHNDNTVNLEYSNNPYDTNSKIKTVDVKVKDYTFKLNGLKTKEDGTTALPGAKFEISKADSAIYFNKVTSNDGTNVYTVCAAKHSHGSGAGCITEIVSGTNGKFAIVGLDDAVEYTLKETEAPAGYNAIEPMNFKINATYDTNGEITNVSTNINGISKESNSFELATTIVNTTGIKLPETGGIGRVIFVVIGGILMVLAAGLLVLKSRKKAV